MMMIRILSHRLSAKSLPRSTGLRGCSIMPRFFSLNPVEQSLPGYPFERLAAVLYEIEKESSTGANMSLLAQEFFNIKENHSLQDLELSLLLCTSQLASKFDGIEFQFSQKSCQPILQALSDEYYTGTDSVQTLYKKTGDYGDVVRTLLSSKSWVEGEILTVAQVHEALLEISQQSGKGSVLRKKVTKNGSWAGFVDIRDLPHLEVEIAENLIKRCRSIHEAAFIIRFLAHGKLRIGVGEKTVSSAVAMSMLPEKRDDLRNGKAIVSMSAMDRLWVNKVQDSFSCKPSWFSLLNLLSDVVASHNYEVHTEKLYEDLCGRGTMPGAVDLHTPVEPMAAYPTTSIAKIVSRMKAENTPAMVCEYKMDGERIQIHLDRELDEKKSSEIPFKVSLFSRNSESISTVNYEDVLNALAKVLNHSNIHHVQSCVLEGEMTAINSSTGQILPFQTLTKLVNNPSSMKLCFFPFDLLVLNGKPMLDKPLSIRRNTLKELLLGGNTQSSTHSIADGYLRLCEAVEIEVLNSDDEKIETKVQEFFMNSIEKGCEGLMVKALNSPYSAGRRSHAWLKLKYDYIENSTAQHREKGSGVFLPDTLDLVPIGGYYGRGKRANVFGSFLMACYSPDKGQYETIGKVGSGFSMHQLTEITEELKASERCVEKGTVPMIYHAKQGPDEPDVWFDPAHVWEIKATQLTLSPKYKAGILDPEKTSGSAEKGFSLRFPRFVRKRTDKTPLQATNSNEIRQMFEDSST